MKSNQIAFFLLKAPKSRNDLGNILQKAPCAHRNVVYTGGMKLFAKGYNGMPSDVQEKMKNSRGTSSSGKSFPICEVSVSETMRFNNSGMFDRQERNLSDYVWNVIKNPNSVSYSTWGDL